MKRKSVLIAALACTLLCSSIAVFSQTEEETAPTARDSRTSSSRPEPSTQRRLSQRPAGDRRNRFGFSLGLLGFYDSNVSDSISRESMSAISPNPKFFVNLSSRKTSFHFNYEFLFRYYLNKSGKDSQRHEGGVEWIHQLSRSASIAIQDTVQSGPNDILNSISSNSFNPASGQQQVFYDQKNMLQNTLSGSLMYQPPRSRNGFSIRTSYQTYRYDSQMDQNTASVSLNATDNFRISRQWFLVGTLSNDWIDSATNSRNGNLLRFQGGLAYRPTLDWDIAFKAGGEHVSRNSGTKGITYEANVTHTTRLNQLDVRYEHQTGYQIGLTNLNRYHSLKGRFDQQLNARISMHLMTSVYRTNTQNSGKVATLNGSAGFDYALHLSLKASVTANYIYQQSNYPLIHKNLNTDYYILYAGVHYLFPSIRRQPRGY